MTDISPLKRLSGRLVFRATERTGAAIDRVEALRDETAGRIFTRFDAVRVMRAAEALDCDPVRRQGPLAGLTISIKDLFDEAGEVTTAASVYLADRAPAEADAVVVTRLKSAGAIPFGRTTMSEFAYSGVGLNPHFGIPGNSHDPSRIPGGSTSGGALSVALGLADVALGSDTGGSVRIPAAFNGLAGFKPTQAKVPLDGAFPLSQSYDSVGPLARDIRICAGVHAVLCGETPPDFARREPKGLRIGVVHTVLAEGLDAQVAADFASAVQALSENGVELVDVDMPALAGAGAINRVIVGSEAHRVHVDHLDALKEVGDPRVLRRIMAATDFSPGEEEQARGERAAAQATFAALASDFDAFIAPTIPVVPPLIAEVEADYDRLNALVLRNPSTVNFLDGCAATIPMHAAGSLPTGLMVFGPGGADWDILAIAQCFEPFVRRKVS
ncbi:amidase family protein [Aurantimonas marianensis]|uniref:Amidase family protein n=1 Tax=Aurantimonas marianensis TaxID=2920428 RepID=A0A9X2KDM3_9HYPH|nr:amidase family protein [Aurantimonas marianensis]